MADTVGIRFPNSGKTYCFKSEDIEISAGDRVVVESELGISIGMIAKTSMSPDCPENKLRPVLRKVTAADLKQEEENETVRKDASSFCKERIESRALPMKLITTDVTLDRKRFIFYFTADTRIDFRELVKDLASKFRSRIELRQIGVRDAAKLAGGYGICGKEICCKTWLRSFAPISIKMAKQQDLVLNTCKLSGLCGRLLCCLNYEYIEGGGVRKRQKPKREEALPKEAPDTKEPIKVETVETSAKTQDSRGAQSERRSEEDSSSERQHFKKGRRSRRSRASRKAKGPASGSEQTAATAKDNSAPKQEQPKREADSTETKTKRKRRRRRRNRKPSNQSGTNNTQDSNNSQKSNTDNPPAQGDKSGQRRPSGGEGIAGQRGPSDNK